MRLFFHIIDFRPVDVGINKFRGFCRDAMAEVGLLYERAFKMRHFDADASARYGYRPRTQAHKDRKAKAIARNSFSISPDADRDLIMTGGLRRAIRMAHLPQAFPTRVAVNMPTPSYAQMRPLRANMPNLGEEITKLAPDEFAEMERVYHTSLEHDLNTYRAPRTKRIG